MKIKLEELLFCQALDRDLHLTHERKVHILKRHPEFNYLEVEFCETVFFPDFILKKLTGEYLLVKWHSSILNGKFMVIVARLDPGRFWIITSYLCRKPPTGELW